MTAYRCSRYVPCKYNNIKNGLCQFVSDEGFITEEEYEAKKKQILGI